MKKFVAPLVCAILMAFSAFAADPVLVFTRGEVLNHFLSVCVLYDDALKVAVADEIEGMDAATKAFNDAKSCNGLPVTGPAVGRTVYTAHVKRNGKDATTKIVEILVEDKVVAYFVTSREVRAGPIDDNA